MPPAGQRIADRLPRRNARPTANVTVVADVNLVPQRPFCLYLCCGRRRAGDFGEWGDRCDLFTILVDPVLGGRAHDLTDPTVVGHLMALVRNPLCAMVMASFPCKTWCAGRFVSPGPRPLRDSNNPMRRPAQSADHPDGLTAREVAKVEIANEIVANGAMLLCAAHDCGAQWMFECPVPRSKAAAFEPHQAIEGREEHVDMTTHTQLSRAIKRCDAKPVWFDGGALGHATQKTTQLVCTPGVFKHVEAIFGKIRCARGHGGNLLGQDESGDFRSGKSEEYPPEQNRLLVKACKQVMDERVQIEIGAPDATEESHEQVDDGRVQEKKDKEPPKPHWADTKWLPEHLRVDSMGNNATRSARGGGKTHSSTKLEMHADMPKGRQSTGRWRPLV